MPVHLNSKLPNVGTTVFSTMSALASEFNAVNLSQGFPDFSPDQVLINALQKSAATGSHQYAPMEGWFPLREKWAHKMQERFSAEVNPSSQVTVTAGATQAIFTAIQAFVKEDDEVILFSPAYDSYEPAVTLAGGQAVHYQLNPPEFRINWQEVKKLINHRTRMILINTPHNPTASVLTAFDMMQLEKITKGTDILILSDEVYEYLVYDGLEHQSVLRFPSLAQRSLAVFSFGKSYHITGWKVGCVVAPENLMKEFRKVHQFNVFSVNTPAQIALSEALDYPDLLSGLSGFFEKKRNRFISGLSGTKWSFLPVKGTYFALASFRKISEEKDVDFVLRLIKEFGVAAIPVSVFYRHHTDHKLIRFCFAKKDETLDLAIDRLRKV